MKKILAFTFLLTISLTLQAQQIAVKSFRALTNDLDARAYYPKEDRNGEKAALIKIVTNETGFEFDAGSIGIVTSVQKTGEIWLYVPRGSKAVTIKHPKFTLLRNYAYSQAIEAGEVYEMVLVTGKVITTIEEPVVETQWLLISTEPSGADVYINDQAAGKTPYQNELPTGKYTWRVSKELYLPDAGIANLITGGEKQVMNVKLKPNFGTLNITSVPENGAGVSLNGIGTGKVTPCTIEMVPTGDHSISINRDMYETTSQRVTLAAGETKEVTVTMNPTFAQVTVTSEPAADIYINGQLKANSTWQGRLNPGIYTFEAKSDKYLTATEKQTVKVGQPVEIKLSPTPITGNLKIMSTPFEANIKFDGKEIGKTPVTLKNLLIGEHTLEFSMPGYATAYEKATITEGQTTQINATLYNGKQVEITSNPTGADLFIDDKPFGKTPYSGNLSFGNHKLQIEKEGKKATKDVMVNQQGNPNDYKFNLNLISKTETNMQVINFVIHTDLGDMKGFLYNETPQHRDNFVKLAKSGYYDGTLFHRVINAFMIQGGDPNSKNAKPGQALGMGGPGYTIPAEINPTIKHKKGALAAARTGGSSNPLKASSGSQFYIVEPDNGTHFLDNEYTVFGEITEGLDVISKIATVQKDKSDRPIKDITMTIKIVE